MSTLRLKAALTNRTHRNHPAADHEANLALKLRSPAKIAVVMFKVKVKVKKILSKIF
jgi:hypothetical protein